MSVRNGRKPKSPAFQWYASDAIGDGEFAEMTFEERGVFVTLLSYSWLNEGVPADESRLARLLKVTAREFTRFWPAVSRCFTAKPGDPSRLVNPRQERERAYQTENRERMKALSNRGVAARQDHPHGEPHGEPDGNLPYPVSRIPTPCVRDARAREAPAEPGSAPQPPDRPDLRAAHLAMHPTLDSPAVRAALDRWEGHLRERGARPYAAHTWESNLVRWERWGPQRLVAAIDASIRTNHGSVFEHEHDEREAPFKAATNGKFEASEEADVRSRWMRRHTHRIPNPTGMPGEVEVTDKYPGYAAARAELEESRKKGLASAARGPQPSQTVLMP